MHATASSIYLDSGDKVASHTRNKELVISDGRKGGDPANTRVLILQADPLERIAFLDQLAEAIGHLRRDAYAAIVAEQHKDDPEPNFQYRPGGIADND